MDQTLTLDKLVASQVKLTPMMEQYYQIKKDYKSEILLFRMGDFYEVFFEDAQLTSQLLNIALTHRGKIQETPIPMAGIPHHAAAAYVDRITAQGYRVAICEQVEDPTQAKGIVKRAVTQTVSPGIPYDVDKLTQVDRNFIAACSVSKLLEPKSSLDLLQLLEDGDTLTHDPKVYSLVLLDYVHGDLIAFSTDDYGQFLQKLALYQPREIVLTQRHTQFSEFMELIEHMGTLKNFVKKEYFHHKSQTDHIRKMVKQYDKDQHIVSNESLLEAISAISTYIVSTQKIEDLKHIKPLRVINNTKQMLVNHNTLTGLEILPANSDHKKDSSLLNFMNSTKTSMGFRRLKEIFIAPIIDIKHIHMRQQLIEDFCKKNELMQDIRKQLSHVRDLNRILHKLTTSKINGTDLIALKVTMQTFHNLFSMNESQDIFDFDQQQDQAEFYNRIKDKKTLQKTMSETCKLISKIDSVINEDIGATLEKGNLIKPGHCKKRDALANIGETVSDKVIRLETKLRDQLSIHNLKIKSNNINGFFIEVSKSHTQKVPDDLLQRKQTLVNSERYSCKELDDIEEELQSAKFKLRQRDNEIYQELIDFIMKHIIHMRIASQWLSNIDVITTLSYLAYQQGWSRPQISDSKCIQLKGAWHPLIKSHLKNSFVPHNISLDEKNYFALITGPNMAGKTTVMREVAIIQFLTQLGSFVPAVEAKVSLCDFLFSRLGAGDDITRGQSTFMVEMTETAEILRHATSSSLILLDELGRGTSTYDGLSLATAVMEYLVTKVKALTLFSTHYHELIERVEKLSGAKNLTVKISQHNDKIHFLYELIPGGAKESFGIHVAKLAGLPESVTHHAATLLEEWEQKNHTTPIISSPKKKTRQFSPITSEIAQLEVEHLTPLMALNVLSQLQKKCQNELN